MIQKGNMLIKQDKSKEGITVFDEVVHRFGNAIEPESVSR